MELLLDFLYWGIMGYLIIGGIGIFIVFMFGGFKGFFKKCTATPAEQYAYKKRIEREEREEREYRQKLHPLCHKETKK